MQNSLDDLKSLYQTQKVQALHDFFTFLSFPSISTDKSYAAEVKRCADWLQDYLRNMGFSVEQWPTSGYPTLYATHLHAGPDKPTLLIYNHYDVQPVDPLDKWETPPFTPTTRDGKVYARGAQDNKGQCFYTIQALKALLKKDQKLPINIKLCIEGEEESGSAGLSGILHAKKKELKSDYLVIVDVGLLGRNRPSVTLGTRGLVTMEIELTGSNTDLHSGSHGGIAYNPNHALVELLASLRDHNGKITVPGFYDDVEPVSKGIFESLDSSFNSHEYAKTFGTEPSGGEKDYSPLERNWLRPTLEINGLSGGYSGPGFKTVIPAKASAKISCRLVPNQDPMKIGQLVTQHLQKKIPKGITIDVKVYPGVGKAVRAEADSQIVKAFAQAYTEVFNKKCTYIFEGASIPIVPELAAISQSELVLVGLGLPDDCIHAPNEHFGLDRFEHGFLTIARAIEILGGK